MATLVWCTSLVCSGSLIGNFLVTGGRLRCSHRYDLCCRCDLRYFAFCRYSGRCSADMPEMASDLLIAADKYR